jgi:outer membrane autotransporter protein
VKIVKEGVGNLYLGNKETIELGNFTLNDGNVFLRSGDENSAGKTLKIDNFSTRNREGDLSPRIVLNINLIKDTVSDTVEIGEFTGEKAILKIGKNVAQDYPFESRRTEDDDILLASGKNVNKDTFKIEGNYGDKYLEDRGAMEQFYGVNENKEDGLWLTYLSLGEMTPTYETAINMPILNVLVARFGMNSLERRLGDLHGFDNKASAGLWGRVYGKSEKVKDIVETDVNLVGGEIGLDVAISNDDVKLFVGLMGGYIDLTKLNTEVKYGRKSEGSGASPSFGTYLSLVTKNRFFVDVTLRNFWTELDIKNYSLSGEEIRYRPERQVLTASVEIGKTIKTDLAKNSYFRIEPKLEGIYMNAARNALQVENGDYLEYSEAVYFTGKAGLTIGAVFANAEGRAIFEPFMEFAYLHEFDGKNDIKYGGYTHKSDLGGVSTEFNAGLNVAVTKDMYIYGLVGIENGDKYNGVGWNIGMRVGFGGSKGGSGSVVEAAGAAGEKQKFSDDKFPKKMFVPDYDRGERMVSDDERYEIMEQVIDIMQKKGIVDISIEEAQAVIFNGNSVRLWVAHVDNNGKITDPEELIEAIKFVKDLGRKYEEKFKKENIEDNLPSNENRITVEDNEVEEKPAVEHFVEKENSSESSQDRWYATEIVAERNDISIRSTDKSFVEEMSKIGEGVVHEGELLEKKAAD